ncbi:hypothetical protein T458_05360 [Brevibacillus panacihumi W25]|uniref:Uncharacterized protein n=1 Tax=Brevibacillus panacihumi W25 TaxID=1408254 RepID=V6MBX7_9BACL|nr:hypothetical protein [Brevibacillus panacihumi]EST55757.1 hypothetical protein T458_05360 [Brevibacillus panacihumi W25]
MYFSQEDVDFIQNSLDNLHILKLLHDDGFDISTIEHWIEDSAYHYTRDYGYSLFYSTLDFLFTGVTEEDCSGSQYNMYKFVLQDDTIQKCINIYSLPELQKKLQSYLVTQYDPFGGAELILTLKEDGLIIEIHDIPYLYHTFVKHLIQLKKVMESLSHSQERK